MRWTLLLAVAVLIAGGVWIKAYAEDEAAAPSITWHTDLEAARTKARDEDRPLVVVFQ